MATSPFPGVIVFTSRTDILSVFRAELKEVHMDPIVTPEGVTRCIEDLIRFRDGLLILDWGVGVDKAVQVLEAVRSPTRMEMRPIFLFSQDDQDDLEGVAFEYGVVYVHKGEMTRNVIKQCIQDVIKVEGVPEDVREGYQMVAEARKRGDWAASLLILKGLHEQFPDLERIRIDYAENLFKNGQKDEAKTLLVPYCDQKDADPRALNIMGRIQLVENDVTGATTTLQKAKLINPFNIDRLLALGDAYLKINKPTMAEKEFKEALGHGHQSTRAVEGLGKSLLVGGKINEGLAFLKQMSSNREMASVFNAAAILSIRGNRYSEGMKLYNVAFETVEREAQVVGKLAFNMGIALHRQGKNDRAIICLGIAQKLDPENDKAKKNYLAMAKQLGAVELPDEMSALIQCLRDVYYAEVGTLETIDDQGSEAKDEKKDGNDEVA